MLCFGASAGVACASSSGVTLASAGVTRARLFANAFFNSLYIGFLFSRTLFSLLTTRSE